jgi:hypothetical protein
MKNIRNTLIIPNGVLPSRKELKKISDSVDIGEHCEEDTQFKKNIHKATESSWVKIIKMVNSSIFINKKEIRITPEIIIKKLEENRLHMARLVGSKSYYCTSNPQNVVFFNANLIDEKLGKVWFGDLDLTKDAPILIKIAKELKTTFYVLREMDCRFNNENKSIKGLRKVSKWNTNKNIPVYDKDFKIVA